MAEVANDRDQGPIKILDFTKLQLFTPTPGVQGVRAKLSFGFRDGNPRITVFTNDPNDTTAKGIIYAGMLPEVFEVFLAQLDTVIRSKEEMKQVMDCYTQRYEDNKPTGERVLNSQVWVGKDTDGMIWISVTAKGRPQIKFTFQVSDWHKLLKGDGTPFSESEASRLAALAHMNLLRQVYAHMLTQYLQNPPAPREFGNRLATPTRLKPTGFDSEGGKGGGLMFDNDVPF